MKKATKEKIKGTKSEEKLNLGKHLQKIKDIAFKGEENTIDGTDLTNMSRLDILEHFIKVDESPNIAEVQDKLNNQRRKVVGVMKSFGNKICDLKRYRPKQRSENDDDEEEEDDDNADESQDIPDLSLGDGFE